MGKAMDLAEPKGLGVGDSSKWRRVGVICTWRDMLRGRGGDGGFKGSVEVDLRGRVVSPGHGSRSLRVPGPLVACSLLWCFVASPFGLFFVPPRHARLVVSQASLLH